MPSFENEKKVLKENEFECADCSKVFNVSELKMVETDRKVCLKCFESYFLCPICDKMRYKENGSILHKTNGRELQVCEVCADGFYRCNACEELYETATIDREGNYYCTSCRESGSGNYSGDFLDDSYGASNIGFDNLPFSLTTKKHRSKDKGEIITDDRGFSCEIECYYPNSTKAKEVYKEITKKDSLVSGTGISGDGSLGGRGIEYQTPILRGKKGEEYIYDFCKLLNDRNYKTDISCGLHIHLDGKDLYKCKNVKNGILKTREYYLILDTIKNTKDYKDDKNECVEIVKSFENSYRIPMERSNFYCLARRLGLMRENDENFYLPITNERVKGFIEKKVIQKLKKLFLTYYYVENVLLHFLPESRRKSTYCLPIDDNYSNTIIDKCDNVFDFEKHWYSSENKASIEQRKSSHHDSTRYSGVNFHTLLGFKHLEIRHHSGTTNSIKILYWIKLNQAVIRYAIGNSFALRKLKELRKTINLSDKRKLLYEILDLDEKTKVYFESRAKLFTSDDDRNTNSENEMKEPIPQAILDTKNELANTIQVDINGMMTETITNNNNN